MKLESECPHTLSLPYGLDLGCELNVDHKGKHSVYISGRAFGPRPRGGREMKDVDVKVEWDR